MKSVFESENSEVFQIAQFIRLVDSLPLLATRVIAILLFLFSGLFFSLTSSLGIFLLLLSFEIFYRFQIKHYSHRTTLATFPDGANLADVFDQKLAKLYLGSYGAPNKILSLLLHELEVQLFLARMGLERDSLEKLGNEKNGQTFDLLGVTQKAYDLAKSRSASKIGTLDVFHGLFLSVKQFQKMAFDLDLKEDDLENIAFWVQEEVASLRRPFINLDELSSSPGIAQDWISGYTLETQRFTRDITKKVMARQNLPHLVGRDRELSQIEEVLSRDKKKNLILVGEPGIGKTTIVYALAARCLTGHIIPALRYKRILELSLGDLLSSAEQGELERRLTNILDEITHAGDVIFYIPDIENISGSQTGIGKVDITGILLPTLRSEDVQVIGGTTQKGYRRYIEGRPAFAEEFDKIVLGEPTPQDAIKIAEQAVVKIEKHQRATFTYKAVAQAVKLSDRYMKDRVLPGKAIDLLDQSAVATVQKGHNKILEEDIVKLISEKKKIPLDVASGDEKKRLLGLEGILHERVVGQDEAIKAVSEALRRARAFVREQKRPIGTFLFLGPTGVGKTETARALSQAYFGGEEEVIRLDMSEYQNVESIERLIGSSPGHGEEKGQLTEAVRSRPFALILLDEMEKAHRAVLQLFLQVFDEGRLTDAEGTTIDFTQTIIIATSNAGAVKIREALLNKKDLKAFKSELVDHLIKENIFTPEFLNRFDDVVLFKPLSEEDLRQVVKIQMGQVVKNLSEQEITIEVSDTLLVWLAKTGYDPVFGARPLRRLIQDKIEGYLADKILAGEVVRGEQILLDVSQDGEVNLQKKGAKFTST